MNNIGTFAAKFKRRRTRDVFQLSRGRSLESGHTQAVEFGVGVGVGEYQGVVRVPRQVFRRFIDGAVTPERWLEAYHLHRTRFELVAERKLRNRQLTEHGNVEITGRDLRAIRASIEPNLSATVEHGWRQARN